MAWLWSSRLAVIASAPPLKIAPPLAAVLKAKRVVSMVAVAPTPSLRSPPPLPVVLLLSTVVAITVRRLAVLPMLTSPLS